MPALVDPSFVVLAWAYRLCVVGGIVWVVLFVVAGYAFGNIPAVKRNFQFVLIGIIIVSILPGVIEVWKARREKAHPPEDGDGSATQS